MEEKYVLIVDFGTSKVRVNLINTADGTFIDSCSREYQMLTTDEGLAEIDTEKIWNTLVECMEDVVKNIKNGSKVEAIGFSYFGDNLILMDKDYKPLSNCILCFDSRGKKEASEITEKITGERLIETIGSPYSYMSTGAKILWIKYHMPDMFEKAEYFFTIQQFINNKLGLEAVNDGTMASRKQMYDTENNCWFKELMDVIGITEESLGKVLPTNTVIGHLEKFGPVQLPNRTAVILGGHDCDMGIIGLGVGNEKEPVIADITGTYDHVAYLADGMVNMKKRNPKGRIESYCGPLADTSVCIGACTTSGALLEWFMKEINGDTGQEAYKAFWEKARFDGNGGVKVNPDFAGNEGSFSGLGLGIEKSDIFQGIIEALTLKMKEIIDDLISLKAGEVKKVRIGGGAANSSEWIQLRADITGLVFEKMKNIQVSALGAAVVAAYTVGIYETIDEAITHMVAVSEDFRPDMEIHRKYSRKYQCE